MCWDSDAYVLWLDGACTVLLILESLVVLVSLLWMIVALIIKKDYVKPLQCLLCTLFLSFYFDVNVYWNKYYVGFKSTELIETSHDWIVQFHCYSEYSDKKLDLYQRWAIADSML